MGLQRRRRGVIDARRIGYISGKTLLCIKARDLESVTWLMAGDRLVMVYGSELANMEKAERSKWQERKSCFMKHFSRLISTYWRHHVLRQELPISLHAFPSSPLLPIQLDRNPHHHHRRSRTSSIGSDSSRPGTPFDEHAADAGGVPCIPSGLRAGTAIFVVTTYIFGFERHIQQILTSNAFNSVVFFCSMSDAAHGAVSICGMLFIT